MKLGLIGCGRMGRALAVGAIDAGAVPASDLVAYDLVPEAVRELASQREIVVAPSLQDVITGCNVLLLCTKPGDVPGVLREIAAAGIDAHDLLIISIAAGVTVQTIEHHAAGHARVIRAMPNTPALVGQGASGFTPGSGATREDAQIARNLLGAVGSVVEIKESLMDAVTGLSGSGPAYVYTLIEALADGGVHNGLPREHALELATQTVLGAATIVQSTGQHPAILRDMVTSPGGTTMAGLATLEAHGFRSACIEAVTAATERSRELGQA